MLFVGVGSGVILLHDPGACIVSCEDVSSEHGIDVTTALQLTGWRLLIQSVQAKVDEIHELQLTTWSIVMAELLRGESWTHVAYKIRCNDPRAEVQYL